MGGYRFIDSTTRLGITHVATNTKLRAISSNAKTSFGLVGVPLVVLDEPGGLEIVGGQMLSDSLFTAQGKPGSDLKIILIGTLAPMAIHQGHWWYDLIHTGTTRRVHVQTFQGDADTWDKWQTIRKANPLTAISPSFRRKLLEERDTARGDSRLKARFLSYRLNVPSADESALLLTVEDWQRMVERDSPDRSGKPLVGVDLGGGRAWSAAVAIYQNGRIEALAVAPGIPDIETQEKRDHVPAGTYQTLVNRGLLLVAEGLRVQPPSALWDSILQRWGEPVRVIGDRFRVPELRDSIKGHCTVEERVTQWSDASFDIRALRAGVLDGPFSIVDTDRLLVAASIAVATVQNDTAGNHRLVKKGFNNTARDDVAMALAMAAGAWSRASRTGRGRPMQALTV